MEDTVPEEDVIVMIEVEVMLEGNVKVLSVKLE